MDWSTEWAALSQKVATQQPKPKLKNKEEEMVKVSLFLNISSYRYSLFEPRYEKTGLLGF